MSFTEAGPAAPHVPPYAATIPNMLRQIAGDYGEREALVRGDLRLSYRELERQSAELARGLLARGVGKGARVGLLMPNGPEFTTAFMAVTRIGAMVAPLSTLYQAPELRWVLNHADIELLLVADRYLNHDYLARLESAFPSLAGQSADRLALPEAPYLRAVLVWGECDRGWARPGPATLQAEAAARPQIDAAFLQAVEANVVPADLAVMIHTSGSTANPKGVVHSHGALLRHAWQKSHDYWAIEPGERILSLRPHFWVAGLAAVLFHSLLIGCTLLIPDDTSGPTTQKLIEEEGVTGICGDEGWFKTLRADPGLRAGGYEVIRLTNEGAAFARRSASGLRYLNAARAARFGAAAALPEELLPRSYGMTETLSAHTGLPRGRLLPPDKAGCCGRPMPGVEVRIVDPATGRELPRGEVGEVQVRGYSLMTGLYKKERGETFTADGFYPTGDQAAMDEDGFIRFSHRMGDMVKISGANVAPLEVEIALMSLPQMERAAVVPLVGERGEAVLAAAVQLRPGERLDEAAVRAALRQQLSAYKVPKRVFALDAEEMPLTGSGKIRKSDLIGLLAGRMGLAAKAPAET